MRVLQAGMAKSGNYWLYSIIRQIESAAGRSHRSWIGSHPIQQEARTWDLSFEGQHLVDVVDVEPDGLYARISSRFREKIEDEGEYFDYVDHVWTHSEVTSHSDAVFDRFDRIIYIVRDPRDVAISLSRFLFTDYMREFHPHRWPSPRVHLQMTLGRRAREWCRHVRAYLDKAETHDIHFVAYESMRRDPCGEIGRLASYLNADLSDAEVQRIADATSLSRMRSTQNGQHIRRGQVYGWTDSIGALQNLRVLFHVGALLAVLGYPLTHGETETEQLPMPTVPDQGVGATIEGRLSSFGIAANAVTVWRRVWKPRG